LPGLLKLETTGSPFLMLWAKEGVLTKKNISKKLKNAAIKRAENLILRLV
jgi:hypothetical protein